jgi:glutathione S-transferase
MPDITLYTNPMSRGRIVRWMLEEIGLPYQTKVIAYGPEMKTPEYLAINPMGKVPAIRHGQITVTETSAICAYLADAFPEANLAPATHDPLRGEYYRWMFFGAGPLDASVTNKKLGVEFTADNKGFVGYGSYEKVMDVLETALSNCQFIAGNHFTTADLYVGSQIGWGLQFGSIEKRHVFEEYWKRLSARPAYARAKEIDDSLNSLSATNSSLINTKVQSN